MRTAYWHESASSHIANSKLEHLPCFNVMSSISSNPQLSNIDIDQQMPSLTNFNYYTTHDFHSNQEIHNLKFEIKKLFFSAPLWVL